MLFSWQDSMTTGYTEIDEQHKELLTRFNELYEAMAGGKGRTEIENILNYLAKYISMHFTAEERLMEETNCSAAKQNKQAHAEFIHTFDALYDKFLEEGASVSVVLAVNKEFKDWITNHFLEIDSQLIECSKR